MVENADEFLDRLDQEKIEIEQREAEERERRDAEARTAFLGWYPIIREYLTALAKRHFGGDDFVVTLKTDEYCLFAYYLAIAATWEDGQKHMLESFESEPYWVDSKYKKLFYIKVLFRKLDNCMVYRGNKDEPILLDEDILKEKIAELHACGPELVFEGERIDQGCDPFTEEGLLSSSTVLKTDSPQEAIKLPLQEE